MNQLNPIILYKKIAEQRKNIYSIVEDYNAVSIPYEARSFVSISDHWSDELLIAQRVIENEEWYAVFSLYEDNAGASPNGYFCSDEGELGVFVYQDLRLSVNSGDEDGIGFIAAIKDGKWGVVMFHLPHNSSRVESQIVAPFHYTSFDDAVAAIQGDFKPKYGWTTPLMTDFFHEDIPQEQRIALGLEKVVFSKKVQELAEAGNPVYQAILSLCYFYGSGIMRDLKKAYEWATKAADSGWGNSRDNDLFYIYEALMVEDRAFVDERVELGDTTFMVHMAADYHWGGESVEQDDEKAKRLLERASSLGDPEAMLLLDVYYGEE